MVAKSAFIAGQENTLNNKILIIVVRGPDAIDTVRAKTGLNKDSKKATTCLTKDLNNSVDRRDLSEMAVQKHNKLEGFFKKKHVKAAPKK